MIDMLLYYGDVLLCTIGGLILCGLLSAQFEKLFVRLVGGAGGYKAIMATAIIGTPVHEAGHALMCLIFGHKINEIKLYQPDKKTGTLGYVSHSYNKKNLGQNIGNFFIGLGPIFSGLVVITLILFVCFTDAANDFFQSAFALVKSGDGIFSVIGEIFRLLWHMLTEKGNIIVKIIAFMLMSAIVLHVNLSPADIKNSKSGLATFAIVAGVFTFVTSFLSLSAIAAIRSALHAFATYCFVVFALIYAIEIFVIAVAAIFYAVKRIKK